MAARRRAARRGNIATIFKLIFCFPLGLHAMWVRSGWPRVVKTGVSVLVAAVVTLIFLPLTNPPEPLPGGIVLVGATPHADVYGPEAPEGREIVEIYAPRRTSVVVEPTPTPTPVYVFYNDGGQYYHTEACKYYKATSQKTTLTAALKAGYKACSECSPPQETEY